MKSKRVLGLFFKFFIFSIGLVGFFVFYLQFVINDLRNKTTILAEYEEEREHYDFPTVTLCFDEKFKPSAMVSRNITSSVSSLFNNKDRFEKHFMLENMTFAEAYEALSYRLNDDFEIQLSGLGIEKASLRDGSNSFSNSKTTIQCFQIPTKYNGMCYAIKGHEMELKLWDILRFDIKFNANTTIKDVPKAMKIFITSNTTSDGIIENIWHSYNPLLLGIPIQSSNGSFNYVSKIELFEEIILDKRAENITKRRKTFKEITEYMHICQVKCLPFLYAAYFKELTPNQTCSNSKNQFQILKGHTKSISQ